jgi:hypothetical protein
MKRPGDKKKDVPPGGRAAERVRQDRLARGMAPPPKSSRPRGKAKRTASRKRR